MDVFNWYELFSTGRVYNFHSHCLQLLKKRVPALEGELLALAWPVPAAFSWKRSTPIHPAGRCSPGVVIECHTACVATDIDIYKIISLRPRAH